MNNDEQAIRTWLDLSLFRKQPDSRWLLARDANLLMPEELILPLPEGA
jgi:hypothetical protein